MNYFKKTAAFFMSIIMLISIHAFVAPVFAEDLVEPPMNESLMEKEKTEPKIISEVLEKRDEYIKHFYMSDGTFLATKYTLPVHFKTENGDWVEYDNTLEQQGDEDTGVYTTVLSNHPTSLAIKAAPDRTASIDDSEYPISWGYEGAKSSKLRIDDKNVHKQGNEKFTSLDSLTSSAKYKNLFPHVDLEYIIDSTGVKENLILKNKNAANEFVVDYRIGNLNVRKKDNQTVELINENEETIYIISAPKMYDSKEEYSEALTLAILSVKDGVLRVSVKAGKEWLLEKNRAYPVVLDPVTIQSTDSLDDKTYVTSANPNESFSNDENIVIGNSSALGNSYGLFKQSFTQLQVSGFHIASAKLRLAIDTNNNSSITLKAYEAENNWASDSVTWNTKPAFSNTILDYDTVSSDSTEVVVNITKMLKNVPTDSFTDLNDPFEKSVIIKTDEEKVISIRKMDYTRPVLEMTYVDLLGLDKEQTYSQFDMGLAGTVYINNLTGNLVMQRDNIATSSEIHPYVFSSTYNSFSPNMDGLTYLTHSQQSGFKPFRLFFTEDGSFRFFKINTEENDDGSLSFIDENEYGWERIKTTRQDPFIINGRPSYGYPAAFDVWKSSGNEKYSFDPKGILAIEVDGKSVLNRETVMHEGLEYDVYTDDNYNKVCIYEDDTEYRIVQLSRSGESYVVGDVTRYVKDSNGYVTSICKNNQTLATFTFDNNRITTITNDKEYKLSFTYVGDSKVISHVQESQGEVLGREYSFNRAYDRTTIRSAGADCLFGNEDDVLTTYVYDYYARVTSEQNSTVSGEDLGSTSYQYDNTQINSPAPAARSELSRVSLQGKHTTNIIRNHNMETTNYWLNGCVDDNQCDYTYALSNDSMAGNSSLSLTVNNLSSVGGAGFYQTMPVDDLTLEKDCTYTASVYVKTSGLTKHAVAGDTWSYGATVMAQIDKSDGSSSREYAESISKTEADIDNGWERIWLQFHVPSNATQVTLYLLVRNATGTASFDCVQLERGETLSQYNLIENNGFYYTDSADKPTDWFGMNLDNTDCVNNNKQMKIQGNPSLIKGVYQYVPLRDDAEQSDTYVLSGWANAAAVPQKEGRYFVLYAVVQYRDTDDNIVEKEQLIAHFNYEYEGEQFLSGSFDLSDPDNPDLTPVSIMVAGGYANEENTAFFDSLSLIRSNDVYDLTDAEESEDENDPYTYNEDGSLATYTNEEGTVYYYTYDSYGNLLSRLTSENIGDYYTYYYYDEDNDGTDDLSVIHTEIYEDGTQFIYTYDSTWTLLSETEKDENDAVISVFTYDSDGRIVTEQTNAGLVYTYTYDSYGNILSKLTANGIGDQYTYRYFDYNNDGIIDESLMATESLEDGTFNEYVYYNNGVLNEKTSTKDGKVLVLTYDQDGKMTKANHNGFDYNYSYNLFDNPLTVKIGSQLLVTYNYRVNNGGLQSVTYGNNSTESYEYNADDELKCKSLYGQGDFSFKYNSEGNLLYSTDTINNQRVYSQYNKTGRKIGERVYSLSSSNENNSFLYSYNNVFDGNNRVTKSTVAIKGKSVSVPYSYTNLSNGNTSVQSVWDNNKSYTVEYDENGNTISRSFLSETPWTESINYDVNGNITTYIAGEDQYDYTYNSSGNVISLMKNNVLQQSYVYDTDGQLIRENNLDTNKTILYSYDGYGNILQKKEYAYTTEAVGAVTSTVNYAYDSSWKDKLTSYNGQLISYDSIGNPTVYCGATTSWVGRQLNSYSKGNVSVSYKYNSDGLRTQKIVNGTAYEYYYVNDRLVFEKCGDIYEHFYCYDNNGRLIKVKRVDLTSGLESNYFVVTNLQGDVIGLLNENGIVIAKYTYDSWGLPVSVTDSNGMVLDCNHIANQLSIRYRSYYYDSETGLYYLQSRYYDPETGRMLNVDDVNYIGTQNTIVSYNAFVYCDNNPINHYDLCGKIKATANNRYIVNYVYIHYYSFMNVFKKTLKNFSNISQLSGHIDFSIWNTIYSYGTDGAGLLEKLQKKAKGYLFVDSVTHWQTDNEKRGIMKVKHTVKIGLTDGEYAAFAIYIPVLIATLTSQVKQSKTTETKKYVFNSGTYSIYNLKNANCATFVRDILVSLMPDLFGSNKSLKKAWTPSAVYKNVKDQGIQIK